MPEAKTHRHRAAWPDFNGTASFYTYRNGLSEPLTEREAKRMCAAMGGHIEAIPSIEEPDQVDAQVDAQVAADREDAGMAPEPPKEPEAPPAPPAPEPPATDTPTPGATEANKADETPPEGGSTPEGDEAASTATKRKPAK